MATSVAKETLPLPSIQYKNDGTIIHLYHKIDENGKKCSIKRVIDLGRNPEECKKAIEMRQKSWIKFGAAVKSAENNTQSTHPDSVDVPFKLYQSTMELELAEQGVQKKEKASVVDRTCHKCGSMDHPSFVCPFKDKIVAPPPPPPSATTTTGTTGTSESAEEEKPEVERYVAPRRLERSSDEYSYSIRIANLAEHTSEEDVRDLVRRFGRIQRVFMSKYDDGRSRGFAFVNFFEENDMNRAIESLHGHGYSNLILSCERAKKKEHK